MSFVTTNGGKILLLRYMLGHTAPGPIQLHLFTNSITPAETDTLALYTESAAAGYAYVSLPGTSWTYATSSGTSAAVYARQTFTYTTSETVQGYYMTNVNNVAAQELIHVEKFTGAPYIVPSGGGTIAIDPKIILSMP